MSGKKKQEKRFSLDSPVITIGRESTTSSTRSTIKTEKSVIVSKKTSRPQAPQPPAQLPPPLPPPPAPSKLIPYTPPDVLMFALFSAIQRRAWIRARRLSDELILCDPLRKTYRDLHDRIDQIIKLMNQRLRPAPPPPPARSANTRKRTARSTSTSTSTDDGSISDG